MLFMLLLLPSTIIGDRLSALSLAAVASHTHHSVYFLISHLTLVYVSSQKACLGAHRQLLTDPKTMAAWNW